MRALFGILWTLMAAWSKLARHWLFAGCAVSDEDAMGIVYFAYGSNMLPARLKVRCESARVIGVATAPDHGLEFSKRGYMDHSGKASLISAGYRGVHTPGVLYEITNEDLVKLDRAEGVGHGYNRHDGFPVVIGATGETVKASTYIATLSDDRLRPFDWYLALVIAGALHHALDAAHAEWLQTVTYVIDTDHTRKGRNEALAALREHGIADHAKLLTGR